MIRVVSVGSEAVLNRIYAAPRVPVGKHGEEDGGGQLDVRYLTRNGWNHLREGLALQLGAERARAEVDLADEDELPAADSGLGLPRASAAADAAFDDALDDELDGWDDEEGLDDEELLDALRERKGAENARWQLNVFAQEQVGDWQG